MTRQRIAGFGRIRLWAGGAMFLTIGALGGCASIVSDNESTVYIVTDPENARCELHGQDFTRVINTPSSITLPAKAAPITVACQTDGYRLSTGELDTSADGWMLDNVVFGLLGGPIGLAIDAARGAGMKYPPEITVVLEPESFDSVAARDLWFDDQRQRVKERWDHAVSEPRTRCRAPLDECERRVKKAEEARGKEIEHLEARRAAARIDRLSAAQRTEIQIAGRPACDGAPRAS